MVNLEVLSVYFNLNENVICIHYNKDIIIHFTNTLLLAKCIANTASKYRIYIASSQRAQGAPPTRLSALEDPTTLPQRTHSALKAVIFNRN